MALIAGTDLLELIDNGVITALKSNVNAASIDIRIGDEILIEDSSVDGVVDIDAKQSLKFIKVKIPEDGVVIYPGQFFLAHTMEFFNLPDTISAEFVLRSTLARNGLNHMLAGFADAGWHGAQLTMEFKNETSFHPLLIKPGMRVGQIKFYQHKDAGDLSYAKVGSYNKQTGATVAFGGSNHRDMR